MIGKVNSVISSKLSKIFENSLSKGIHSNDRFDQMEGEMFLNGKEISQDYYEDIRKFTKISSNYGGIKILNNFLHRVLSDIFFRRSFFTPRNLFSGSFYTNDYDKVLISNYFIANSNRIVTKRYYISP